MPSNRTGSKVNAAGVRDKYAKRTDTICATLIFGKVKHTARWKSISRLPLQILAPVSATSHFIFLYGPPPELNTFAALFHRELAWILGPWIVFSPGDGSIIVVTILIILLAAVQPVNLLDGVGPRNTPFEHRFKNISFAAIKLLRWPVIDRFLA